MSTSRVAGAFEGTGQSQVGRTAPGARAIRLDAAVAPAPVLTVTDVGPESPPTSIAGDRTHTAIEPGFPSVLDSSPAPIEPSLAAPDQLDGGWRSRGG